MQVKRKLHSAIKLIKSAVEQKRINKERAVFERALLRLAERPKAVFFGNVLVDAAWDNPNYWLRYSLLRAALGFAGAQEFGVLGPHRREQQKATMVNFGFLKIFDACDVREFRTRNHELANELLAGISSQQDILAMQLPYDVPSDFLYDYILKIQRSAEVKINDKSFKQCLLDFLNIISVSAKIIKQVKPRLIISSHVIGLYNPLVWIGLKMKVPVIVPCSGYGSVRLWHIRKNSEIYDYADRPSYFELELIDNAQKNALLKAGNRIITSRINGAANDIGSEEAYNHRKRIVNKKDICTLFGWSEKKKIVAVYASNLFDYPHTHGMNFFDNFYGWLTSIYNVAQCRTDINWLFKPHPCDHLYCGVTVSELFNFGQEGHIQLALNDWNGADMLHAIDAFVTYHGTVGIEATALGKPVLVADNGWYEDWGFVRVPKSREDFLELLGTRWWEDMDVKGNSRLAKIFAGWYWGRPEWQKNFVLEDDSRQWEIYKTAPDLIKNNMDIIEKEISMVREWFNSSHPHFHTYKMMQTDKYIV